MVKQRISIADQQEIKDAVDETRNNPIDPTLPEKTSLSQVAWNDSNEENISAEHSLQTVDQKRAVAPSHGFKGVAIEGLEEIPMSMVAVPWLRLIQPTSQKTEDSKGTEVLPGNFLFNDTLKAYGVIDFVLLRAKVGLVTYKRPDGDQTVQRLTLLGMTAAENKLFSIALATTSFTNWGRLMAQFLEAKVKQSYRFVISMSSEKKENDKGKFYVAKFQIGEELNSDQLKEVAQKAHEYGAVLDKREIEEDDFLGK